MLSLTPYPGYIVAKPYTLENKAGAYHLPPGENDPDKAPEFGEVIAVGPMLPIKKMPYSPDHVPKVGDKVAYKRFNYFTLQLGTKRYAVVHFENVITTITEKTDATKPN